MSKGLEALEIIKEAPTIYVGCGSDIYTRYPHECRIIEKELKALEIIKECFDINGFDEFIPNIKWYDKKNENKRKLIEEVFYD